MKKAVILSVLTSLTLQTAMVAPSFAADQAATQMTEAQKVELKQRMAQASLDLRKIEERLSEAQTEESIKRVANSAVFGGEAFGVISLIADLMQKNKAKAAMKLKYLGGLAVAHISYLTLSPERTNGKAENALEQRRDEAVKTLQALQAELAKAK